MGDDIAVERPSERGAATQVVEAAAWHASRARTCEVTAKPSSAARMVDRVRIASLTPEEFAERYLRPNRPVLLTGVGEFWRCQHWVTADGRPDIAFLAATFGDSSGLSLPDGSRSTMTVAECVTWWRGSRAWIACLKDWHFQRAPRLRRTRRIHVADDWLTTTGAGRRGRRPPLRLPRAGRHAPKLHRRPVLVLVVDQYLRRQALAARARRAPRLRRLHAPRARRPTLPEIAIVEQQPGELLVPAA